MKKYAFRKIFAIVLTTALVFAFTVPVSATGAPEEVYTPAEVTVPEKAPADIPESAAEPTGKQLALIKDISVPEPTKSVSEPEAPVIPSEETVIEEPLEEVVSEEPITEETVAGEPQEAPIETVLEQEEIVYNTSALTLDNLPEYIVNNTLEKDIIAVGLAEENMTELSSFTTINEDETRTLYLFGDPVKYIDKTDNSIRFIDNSILPLTSENGGLLAPTVTGYKNGGNSYDLLMPNRINMGVRFTSDDISVLMTPAVSSTAQGNLKSHSFLGITEQVVEYRNVFGNGIHLQYTPINSGVKENIILDSYSGINTFNFTISTGDYYPLYTEGEAIPFIDPTTDDTAFILGQVDARDSYTGEETDGHFTLYNSLSLTEIRPGLYTLTVTVDEEFLTDPDTVYPVVVDPTITIQYGYIYDTTVYSAMPNTQTFYSSAYNIVGNHGSSYGEGIALTRSKNYFENLTYIWPYTVTSAKYKVYEGSGKTNSMTVRLCSTSASWNQSTVTYNNLSNLKTPTSSLTINKSGWYNFDITPLVKDWLKYARSEGGYTYYRGFALKASATGVSSKHFCSANYSGSLTPSIIINYTGVPIQDLGEVSAWGKHIVCDASYYSFIVPSSGTYYLSTTITNGPGQSSSNTEITVLNTSYNQIAYNQDGLNINCLSRIETQLSAGKYFVYVSDYNNLDERVCYFIIEKSGELQDSTYVAYHKNIYEFKKISDADITTNCLAYALKTTGWISTEGFTRSNLVSKMQTYGYTYTSQAIENCIVAYYNANVSGISEITHFARIDNGIVTSKIGELEVMQHPSYDAYFPNVINGYGMAYAFFVKISN